MIGPIFTEVVLILSYSQTPRPSMIIKSFVALAFVINIDNMFSENFPKEIKEAAKELTVRIGKDQNSLYKIRKRISRAKKDKKGANVKLSQMYKQAFFNIIVNCWYYLMNGFYVIFYYYFFPFVCVIL